MLGGAALGLGQFRCDLEFTLALRLTLQRGVLFLLDGGGDKEAFRRVQALFIERGPLTRLRKARPAIQLGSILAARFPFGDRIGQVTVQKQALAILRQPFVEPLPFANQSLMGDLDAVFAQCDQPCIRKCIQHRPQLDGFF